MQNVAIIKLTDCITHVIHKDKRGNIMSLHKTAIVNARIAPMLKIRAENILNKTGLSSAEAIRLFYTQVCLNNGLPFAVKIPNKITQKAMRDAELRRTQKAKSVDALLAKLT